MKMNYYKNQWNRKCKVARVPKQTEAQKRILVHYEEIGDIEKNLLTVGSTSIQWGILHRKLDDIRSKIRNLGG